MSFVLNLNTTFSTVPTFIGNALSFSLVSGSLPNGITLNPTTGELSGIPTLLGSNQQVTIKASNLLGEIQSTITMSVIPYPISCADGSTLIHIERQTKIDTESTPIHKMVLYHRVHNRRDSNFVAVATAQETKTASRKLASKAIA